MVTKIRHDVLDDLTGDADAATRTFSVEGQHYEIDLIDDNWAEFEEAVAKFIKAARKRGQKRSTVRETSARNTSPDNAAIRAWAREQGIEVTSRGRIPQDLRDRYNAAQG